MSAFEDFLTSRLTELEAASLRRRLQLSRPLTAARILRNGRTLHNFSSNDYLGLASHPRLMAAAHEAIARHGAGSTAARLLTGTLPEHIELEEAIARFKRTPAALSFSSGYAAALGAIPALVGPGDVIWLDKLCHACLIDGARLSGATLRVFPHNDLGVLENRLRSFRDKNAHARVLILTESVFSMDGDASPLRELVEIKERFGAWLFVDEAHGVGVLGERGRGLADALGVAGRIEVQMGTLGKALGASGAYICGSEALREFLMNRARSFIFSTAPPPASAAAAKEAIVILEQTQEGHELLGRLHARRAQFVRALPQSQSVSAIFPILTGAESAAMHASEMLQQYGFLVPAIRYPTVARGAARLRVTLSASHSPEAVEALASALREVLPSTSSTPTRDATWGAESKAVASGAWHAHA